MRHDASQSWDAEIDASRIAATMLTGTQAMRAMLRCRAWAGMS